MGSKTRNYGQVEAGICLARNTSGLNFIRFMGKMGVSPNHICTTWE